MSDPVAAPADLALFMGLPAVDEGRATLLLALAQGFCEDVVLPLPASAKGVVLAAAARAYSNPQQNTAENTGPYGVSRTASVYLTRMERATLRRGAGLGGAGSVSVLAVAANAVQSVTVAATAGTFALILDGVATAPIAFDASAADVQAALSALPNVGPGNVVVTGAFVVTFVNALGNTEVSLLTADASALTGTVTVAVVSVGVAGPGANLPPWDYDYSTREGSAW
ncbi:hypothetical protein [Nocardioides terrisoli]|uniref:hypothetical protein n=1 Tax=Nocardioides terrisoli TaxID=3388267 RepID=UPI00287B981E|nr:hypothetical protein [Nocardioides marmorisolisilvae]